MASEESESESTTAIGRGIGIGERAAGSLRQIAACPSCKAQYDATGLAAGSRFRCSCGTLVAVSEPHPHEAAVVRCSSCGGPRQGAGDSCGFCSSHFTLHERDLHTICPGCASRISDKARFCHSCGLTIAPLGPAGVATDSLCPACTAESKLSSRRLGGERLSVLECNRCAGLWLGREVFRLLEERARERQTASNSAPAHAENDNASGPAPGRMYRPCPMCGKLMHRRNYGNRSGVIVDACAEHGLWFDHGELERIVRWIRDGGLTRAEQIDSEKRRDLERANGGAASATPLFGESQVSSVSGSGVVGHLVSRLFDYILDR